MSARLEAAKAFQVIQRFFQENTTGEESEVEEAMRVVSGAVVSLPPFTDAELGRWRSEVRPWMVVYPSSSNPDAVYVLNEKTGQVEKVYRPRRFVRDVDALRDTDYAAEFYFRQHPDRVWEKAAVGEVWMLEVTGLGAPVAFVRTVEGVFVGGKGNISPKSPLILSGRQIEV